MDRAFGRRPDNGEVIVERKEQVMSETSASQNPQEPVEQEHPAQTESEREEQLLEEEERESFPASDPPANY